MADNPELEIGSKSIERATGAVDDLYEALIKLVKGTEDAEKSAKEQQREADRLAKTLRNSGAEARKYVELQKLQEQGLDRSSEAYNTQRAAILAKEVATKKAINTDTEEYQILEDILSTRESAIQKIRDETQAKLEADRAARKQNKSIQDTNKYLSTQEADQQRAVSLLKLQQRNLDKTSDEYAELAGEIEAKNLAVRKGISLDSDEYKNLRRTLSSKIKNTEATRALRKEQEELSKRGNKELNPSLAGVADRLDEMAQTASLVDGPLGGVASRFTTLAGIIRGGGLLAGLAGISAGFFLLATNFKDGLVSAAEYEVQQKTLQAQLKATGYTAGLSAQQIQDLSSEFKDSTLFGTEQINEVTRALSSFKNIGTDAFERATESSLNLAAALTKDPQEAAETLGQALQNPLEEINSLEESAIRLSDAQREQIRSAIRLNDVYSAQKVILDAVDDQFQNVAKSQRDTLSGDYKGLTDSLNSIFKSLGTRGIPASRRLLQNLTEITEEIEKFVKSGQEEGISAIIDGFDAENRTLEELENKYKDVNKQLDAFLERRAVVEKEQEDANSGILGSIVGASIPAQIFDKSRVAELDEEQTILEAQLETIKDIIAARTEGGANDVNNVEAQKALRALEAQADAQDKLAEAFKLTRDTRSQAFREEQAYQQALEFGRELSATDEDIEKYKELLIRISDATEARVKYNSVLESNKAQRASRDDLRAQIELLRLQASGVSENSAEYATYAAQLEAANAATQAKISKDSELYSELVNNRVATAALNQELRVQTELLRTSSEGALVGSLEKQLFLRKQINRGVREGSAEYIRLEETYKALETARDLGLEKGSAEYKQLIDQAEAVAKLRSEIEETKKLSEAGFSILPNGDAVRQGSLEALQSVDNELRGKLLNLLADGKINKDQFFSRIEELNAELRDSEKKILIPLGISTDADGDQVLASSVEAVEGERQEKLRELRVAYEEGVIADEELYLQRRLELARSYEDQITQAKVEQWQKSAERKRLIQAGEVADSVSAGLETLAAVKDNNKELARVAKVAAIFSASTSLVDNVAEAMSVGFPQNIPLIAGAFAQGAQIVGMAKGLNEPQFAFGGVDIRGKGTGRSDDISARISAGESVVTATATSRYKEELKRMNAGLPMKSGGSNITASPTIIIQGDASENTIRAIDQRLIQFEDRVKMIADGSAQESIQEEQAVGGLLNPI